ncbi:MAG: DUF4440 domain-containing protein [Bacteroidota bacterium]
MKLLLYGSLLPILIVTACGPTQEKPEALLDRAEDYLYIRFWQERDPNASLNYAVTAEGKILDDLEEIKTYEEKVNSIVNSSFGNLLKFQSLAPSEIIYHISTKNVPGDRSIAELDIYQTKDSINQAQISKMQFIAEVQTYVYDIKGIEAARKKWMELCNAHDPAQLVAQVYTEDAFYFNHKPPIRGTQAITEEYQYMAQPDYNLTLMPIYLMPVQSDLAYEIGQCTGSYGGKYAIVWKKVASGEWKVLLDSNY